ncbi:hypothetical protein I4U23_022781 [Adineta vaga]|nr:hypothetical protein I4U23_022781 [Adineta vaga]
MDKIRHEIESYDKFQGFIFSHSTNEECSNLSSKLLINLKSEYSNKTILSNSIFGSYIDTHNMYHLLNYADVIIPMEYIAILNICKHQLEIEIPTDVNVNKLIAMCWSNITCSMRFDGCLLHDLNEFETRLIPIPSLKLISSYLSPLIPYACSQHNDFKSPSVYDMCIPSFIQSTTRFINQINSTSYRLLLTLCLLFRGENIIPKEIGQQLICDMKKWIRFSHRSPSGIVCGINYHRPYIYHDQSDISLTDKQVLMLTNEITTSKYLYEIISNQSDNISKASEEKSEVLQRLKTNYEEFENEMLDDNQSDLTEKN